MIRLGILLLLFWGGVALYGWVAVSSLRTGRIVFFPGRITRREQPITYWINVIGQIASFAVLAFIVGAVSFELLVR